MLRQLCGLFGHAPDRRRVWNDSIDFRAPCIRCGMPLIRDPFAGWRGFDTSRDARPERAPHPKAEAAR